MKNLQLSLQKVLIALFLLSLSSIGWSQEIPVATAATPLSNVSFAANWNASTGATGYQVDVSTTSNFSSYVGSYNNYDAGNVFTLIITGLSNATTYYYRVRAYNAGGTSGNSNVISRTTDIYMTNGSVTTGSARFYDPGGPSGNYGNNQSGLMTFFPSTAGKSLNITFTSFQTEDRYPWPDDNLSFWDAINSSSCLIATYRGIRNPANINITASNSSGALTVYWTTDYSVTNSGWEATITEIDAPVPAAPVATMASSISATRGVANWSIDGCPKTYYLDVATDALFIDFVPDYNNFSAGANTSAAIRGLTPNTTYYYRLRTFSNGKTSINSNTISFTTLASDPYNALNFDGVNDYVNVPYNFTGYTAYTIETWIKPTSIANQTVISGNNGGGATHSHGLEIYNGKFRHYTYAGAPFIIDGTTNVQAGVWYHVAITATNNGMARLFVNGAEEGTAAAIPILWTGGNRFYLGKPGYSGSSFTGCLDEVRFWNSARTQTEIQNNKCIVIDPATPGLVYYYQFDQGISCGNNTSVTTLYDATANNNNGTLTGFTLSGSCISNWVTSGAMTPDIPVTTAATSINTTSFSANWEASTGATGYRLDVATDNGFTSFVPGYSDLDVSNVTTYPVSDLTSGTTYYYRVRASNGFGTSAGSNTTTVVTTLEVPLAIAASSINTTSFSANWDASTGATGYRLDVATDIGFANFVSGYSDLDVSNVTSYPVSGVVSGTTYYYRVRVFNEIEISGSSNVITVEFTDHRLNGYAKYNNNPKTPLNGLKITLKQGVNTIGTPVVTGTSGFYEFTGLINGTYDLEIASAHASGLWQTWGGVNNTDYLLVARHAAGVSYLPLNPPVVLVSGDVKSPSTPPFITTADATAVKYAAKYGWGSPVPYFDIQKWVFSGLNESTALTGIELNSVDVTRDIRGLCAGDVNGSYVPPNGYKTGVGKFHEMSLQVVNRGLLPVTREIIFPVRAEQDMEIGAISLLLDFDASQLEITGVEMPGQEEAPYFFVTRDTSRVTEGVLNIGWMSMNPLRVTGGESVLLIHARLINNEIRIPNSEIRIRFTLNDNPISELADVEGNVIDGAKLTIADAGHASPVTRHENLLSVYPNPVSEVLSIEYLMETEGVFNAELMNPQGVVVVRTGNVNSQSGMNKTTMNLRELPNGTYLLKAVCGENRKTVKVIVNR